MNTIVNKVINPERYLTLAQSMIGSMVVSSAMIILSSTIPIRYDGTLDFHYISQPDWRFAIVDVLSSWIMTATAFVIIARAFGSSARWIDLIAIIGLVKVVYLLPTIGYLYLAPYLPQAEHIMTAGFKFTPSNISSLLAFGILSLISLTFLIYYYFNCYRINSNLKGNQLILSFILAIILAEGMSKAVIIVISSFWY